ncbi:maleylpyruvate isomerase N-terminal domain-containing protein [Kitasatospora nipponensis]|uniref:maleylpyruvate isomerase N-terminal domain-containing protein n=1 Tax=Kitasatospora nipponensis TaxID=258049 RepID=UPI003CD0A439
MAGCPEWDVAELLRHTGQVHRFWTRIADGSVTDPSDNVATASAAGGTAAGTAAGAAVGTAAGAGAAGASSCPGVAAA